MQFRELRLRGFLSFGPDEQVLKLGKRGLVLVEGENRDDPTVDNNGSGKSSISEAILWALFGETLRGVSADDVVNRKLDSGCKVTVVFSNDKGETFKVERHRDDKTEKNRLLFTGPSAGLTANETSATEAKIREALGMDFETFTSAVVFGQGQSKHFASMTDKEMKRVTDKLIGVEALSLAHKHAHSEHSDLHDEMDALKGEMKDLDNFRADFKDAKAEWGSWEKEHQVQLQRYEAQLAALKPPDIKKLTEHMEERERFLTAAESNLTSARESLGKLDSKLAVKKADLDRLREMLDTVTDKPGKCDHCGSDVSLSDLGAHKGRVKGQLEGAQRVYNDVRDDRQAASKLRDDRVSWVDEAKQKLEKARKELAEARQDATKVEAAKKMLAEFKAQTNPHVKAMDRAEKALAEAKDHNATVEKAMGEMKGELASSEFIATMFSDKGGPGLPPLKALLVESVAPFVNKKLAHYSRFLTEGNIGITFETQTQLKSGEYRDTYSLVAKNRFGASAYEGSSGGERRKIDASIFFAFQALAASRAREQVRFAVWDEVFDALDETAQEVMMELLLEEKSRKDTMLVITQRPELRAYFPTVVKVVKEKGFSRLA